MSSIKDQEFEVDYNTTEVTAEERERLADLLFKIGAIKFGAFRIKLHQINPDAPLSPIYINLRVLRSHPQVLSFVARLLDKISRPLEFDLLADIPTAATPIVTMMSYFSGKPMISPRKETKGYGLDVPIDGYYEAEQRVLLVDDLISKGDSKFETLDVLSGAGLVVKDLLMVIDRQQGGAEMLRLNNYKVYFAATISDLLARYHATGAIDEPHYKQVREYLGLN